MARRRFNLKNQVKHHITSAAITSSAAPGGGAPKHKMLIQVWAKDWELVPYSTPAIGGIVGLISSPAGKINFNAKAKIPAVGSRCVFQVGW